MVYKKLCHCGKLFYTTVKKAEECATCLTEKVKEDESYSSLLAGSSELKKKT